MMIKTIRCCLVILSIAAIGTYANAQVPGGGVGQQGSVNSNDCAAWAGPGIIKDAGTGCNGATAANPTATAGPSAVNGTATTFLRSDGAPAIQKASSSVFGIVEVDNSTITASAGVISAAAPAISSVTGLGTGIATALGVNVGTAGSPVVNGGALGSPSSAGTIPAFTLGGTISGGAHQINNVVIGASTPLAGSFTTLAASTSLAVASGSLANSQVLSALGQSYLYTTNNIGTYFTGSALNVGGNAFFSTVNNNQNVGLVIGGLSNGPMSIAGNAVPVGGNWTYINNSQGALALTFSAATQEMSLMSTPTTGSVGGTISFTLSDQIGPAGWTTSSYPALRGQDTIQTGTYWAQNIAGVYSKTCTINAANVAGGITITITGGIVTATSGC
jgi:hypothetical protein